MDAETSQIATLKKALSNDERMQFDVQYASRRKQPSTALILSILLGGIGVDRFYLGQLGLGLLKLFTFGGLFIWYVVDWFVIMGSTTRKNVKVATEISQSLIQMRPSPSPRGGL